MVIESGDSKNSFLKFFSKKSSNLDSSLLNQPKNRTSGIAPLKSATFGDRLALLMRRNDLTNKDVAIALGVVQQSVSKWKNNGNIDDDNLKTLADFFGVNWLALKYGNEVLKSVCAEYSASVLRKEKQTWDKHLKLGEAWHEDALIVGNVGVWAVDIKNNTFQLSKKVLDIYETTQEEFDKEGNGFFKYLIPEEADDITSAWHEALESNGKHEDIHKIVTQKGSVRWVKCASRLISSDDSRTSITGAMVDATNDIETAYLKSKFATVFNNCNKEVYVIDVVTKKFTDINETAIENTGYSREEFLTMNPMDLKSTVTSKWFADLCKSAIEKGDTLSFTTILTRKNGSAYPVEVQFKYINESGAESYMALVTDNSTIHEHVAL